MEKLVMVIADAADLDFLLDRLKDAISNYEKEPSKSNFKKITFHCVLIQLKEKIQQQGVEKTEEELEKFKAGMNILNFPMQ